MFTSFDEAQKDVCRMVSRMVDHYLGYTFAFSLPPDDIGDGFPKKFLKIGGSFQRSSWRIAAVRLVECESGMTEEAEEILAPDGEKHFLTNEVFAYLHRHVAEALLTGEERQCAEAQIEGMRAIGCAILSFEGPH